MNSIATFSKAALRKFVLRTNSVWPFSRLNRIPYNVAIKYIRALPKKFTSIKAIYLRHSMADGTWVPGRSDIDLTIITNPIPDASAEFAFLKSFWTDYQRLQTFFPMLGEIDILNDKLFLPWMRLGIRGYESKDWVLLYGDPVLAPARMSNSEQIAEEAFNYAFRYYRIFFLREFFKCGESSITLQRYVLKMLKYIHYAPETRKEIPHQTLSSNKATLFSLIFRELETYLSVNPSLEFQKSSEPYPLSSQELPGAYRTFLEQHAADVESILSVPLALLDPSQKPCTLLILKDNLPLETLQALIESIQVALAGIRKPVILTPRLLAYLFRVEEPCRYYEISAPDVKVMYGRNLLAEMPPPDQTHLIQNILNKSANLFTNICRNRIIQLPDLNTPIRSFYIREIIQEALSLRLFFDQQVWLTDPDLLLREYQACYPAYAARVLELKTSASAEKCFRLLRDLADDVRDHIPKKIPHA